MCISKTTLREVAVENKHDTCVHRPRKLNHKLTVGCGMIAESAARPAPIDDVSHTLSLMELLTHGAGRYTIACHSSERAYVGPGRSRVDRV